ncbi:TetR/AcrR family transcriptional regulator [Pseudomaricurvus alkylphenolicus]|uniref:TetR/AcrR family transcriptional regulator n=1 Tax=Pseudomaricurvus alkylphenolicus TaxID=1306991 RepID=UPI001F0DEDA1|nr:TetR/AcrR family transcriptional regulator [Pseudomaricurvus alkylphenolicus]NIB40823.1 TetR/AcrR family transcriptional regulator [Pseudomaricurvus alkylphenolicus]
MQRKRQQRELEILKQAKLLIEESGYFDMKISELGKRCGISTGTLYSHYPCKEDLLIALGIQSMERRYKDFQEGVKVGETGAEKLIATCLVGANYADKNPSLAEISNLAMSPSIWKRATPALCQRHQALLNEVWEFFLQLYKQTRSELNEQEEPEPEASATTMGLGVWSLAIGADTLAYSDFDQQTESFVHEWKQAYICNIVRLLKGWGWSHEDTPAVVKRIEASLANSDIVNLGESENAA